jgi:hypothetical protein
MEGSESSMGLTMKERQSLIREIGTRYRVGTKKEKTKILDEFVQATVYNRKYALHQLKNGRKEKLIRLDGTFVKLKATAKKRKKQKGKKIYGPEVIAALRLIWAFFWYRCGRKRSFRSSSLRFYAPRWPLSPNGRPFISLRKSKPSSLP